MDEKALLKMAKHAMKKRKEKYSAQTILT